MGRSPTGWAALEATATGLLVNTKVLLASFVPSSPVSHVTPIRIVGAVHYDTAAAAIGVFAIGAGVFSDTAVAAGVASLPDPLTDAEDDIWMFFKAMPYPAAGNNSGLLTFDGRAARKVEPGMQLAFILANSTTGSSVTSSWMFRILTKTGVRS